MPKLRYNPKTGKMEPEVATYGKDNFQTQMPMQSPAPVVDQAQMIRQSQQERSQGMPTAANAYAPAPSGDPFMDKIKGMLAAGAPAVTNTEEFQKMMPEQYAGNQNLQDLQKSYEQRYQDFQTSNARPGFTDEQVAAYKPAFDAVPIDPATTVSSVEKVMPGPETVNTDIDYWGVAQPYEPIQPAAPTQAPQQQPVQPVVKSPSYNLGQTYKDARSGNLINYTDPQTGETGAVPWGEMIKKFFQSRYPEGSKF